jgi:hypothetical protein
MTSKSFKATELESEYTERRKFLAETANAKGKKADALFKSQLCQNQNMNFKSTI